MAGDTLKTVAGTLVEYCTTGQTQKGLDTLYSADAVSIEAGPGPDGSDPKSEGLDAIRAKHDWWDTSFEVHSAGVDGPYLHGDGSFSVIFDIDATHKESGHRQQMREVAVYTLNGDGKIAREEFFMKN